jgi:hypothetical protein
LHFRSNGVTGSITVGLIATTVWVPNAGELRSANRGEGPVKSTSTEPGPRDDDDDDDDEEKEEKAETAAVA